MTEQRYELIQDLVNVLAWAASHDHVFVTYRRDRGVSYEACQCGWTRIQCRLWKDGPLMWMQQIPPYQPQEWPQYAWA